MISIHVLFMVIFNFNHNSIDLDSLIYRTYKISTSGVLSCQRLLFTPCQRLEMTSLNFIIYLEYSNISLRIKQINPQGTSFRIIIKLGNKIFKILFLFFFPGRFLGLSENFLKKAVEDYVGS